MVPNFIYHKGALLIINLETFINRMYWHVQLLTVTNVGGLISSNRKDISFSNVWKQLPKDHVADNGNHFIDYITR